MQESLFTVAKLDDFVPADHPLRAIRTLVNDGLTAMNAQFNKIYADSARDSVAPEKLVRALLLQVFYSIRSERQLCEQLRYNLLFRWFVGLALDDAIWDHSTFSKSRDRLLEHQVVEGFFAEVMRLADARGLLSKEHFSVDGTLIQAWASQKSFRPKDGSDDQRPGGGGRNAQADWKGQPRSKDTQASTTDPDARTYRKSHNTASILCYQGHVLMENRDVSAVVTHADGFGERRAALAMFDAVPDTGHRSVGADKAYDTTDFIAACRERRVTPHIAANDTRRGGSAIDGRTTRHLSYRLSQMVRKRIEEHFGWGKTIGRIRQTVFRGLQRVDQQFKLTMTASNLMRLARMPGAVRCGAEQQDEYGGERPMPFRCIGCLERDFEKTNDLVSTVFDATARFIFRPNFNSLLDGSQTGTNVCAVPVPCARTCGLASWQGPTGNLETTSGSSNCKDRPYIGKFAVD